VPYLEDALKILGNTGTNSQNLDMLFSCRDTLVPFIGAGLSTDFGYPAWHHLIQGIAAQAAQPKLSSKVDSLLSNSRFEEAAEAVNRHLPNLFDDTLRSTFDIAKLQRPIRRGAVRHIPNIAKGPVLTTNFDHVLEAAFEDAGRPFAQVFPGSRIREASRTIQLGEPLLLKLHGDYLDSASRVLTLSQYIREYGTADPRKANLNLPLPTVLGQALAARPLLFLGCSLKTDRTITVVGRLAEKMPGIVHFTLMSESENTPTRRDQFEKWNLRPIFFPRGQYNKIEEFLGCLAGYWQIGRHHANSFTSGIRPSGNRDRRLKIVAVNGYKLFYFRAARKLSISKLSKISRISAQLLGRLERTRKRPGTPGTQVFQRCEQPVLSRVERALGCIGKLQAGTPDDFLTQYTLFYLLNKNKKGADFRDANQMEMAFQTKAVVFDFDGTLTDRPDDRTTWERIWSSLGYPLNECAELHDRYLAKEGKGFTHQEWCDITAKKFKERNFSEKHLKRIARNTTLVKGTAETITRLKKSGVSVYILSGSIRQIIKECLGELYDSFDEVKANDIIFDSSGVISEIRGTRYDFWGKARFLRKIWEENEWSPWDVLFVGNSVNDDWASLSGVRTLCVNPHLTRPDNRSVWTYAIRRMSDLSEIMKFVRI
jgi:phosphoserine phosphatase